MLDGALGAAQAEGGYLAFCLSNGRFATDEISSSYVVVMDMYGEVVASRAGEAYVLTTDESYMEREEEGTAYSSRFEVGEKRGADRGRSALSKSGCLNPGSSSRAVASPPALRFEHRI